ncbi:MAG TPA: N-acetylmuramoyl-L-alanine amidase [Nocardioidaceae bacterium]|nr:N-acetylmuramoyl-L-alanine amidase [Nocardioidaceae bacterium]
MRSRSRTVAAGGVVALLAGVTTVMAAPGAIASDWSGCLQGTDARQAVFGRAAAVSGVPEEVLLGVSFMESRWDNHGASPSTSAGYGPMHLTAVPDSARADEHVQGKGKAEGAEDRESTTVTDSPGVDQDPSAFETLATAAELLDVSAEQLRRDDVANICGGAALLAEYQHELSPGNASAKDPSAWSEAVARYSGAADQATAMRFAEQVFTVIREGRSRVTNDGHRVTLHATPADVDRTAIESMGLVVASTDGVDCPADLGCESRPAPYAWYDKTSPYRYGNHDLASRQQDMKIDYILIHDTEASWNTTLNLVSRPNYLAWNYSLRSADGHIAQHLDSKNVGWHAGNWYVNMHSIGLEHEGFAAEGASWFTESLYENSAALVRYLAAKYDVPLDRAHIIGHDQVPGVTPTNIPSMHWDPGPYWDWEHYFDLLGAPLEAPRDRLASAEVVTVLPGYEGNSQPITGCGSKPCDTTKANFVYLRQAPSESAPLVKDPGLRPAGGDSTTKVSDVGARAAAGQKLRVAERRGDWLGVWWLGEIGWIHNPESSPVVGPTRAKVVVPAGEAAVPVYGRAYPESSAYPSAIPAQSVVPLPYTIKPGQGYVLTDRDLETDYYYAKTFECAYVAMDCTDVVGQDKYLQIELGHRFAYVRAADVEVQNYMGDVRSSAAPDQG